MINPFKATVQLHQLRKRINALIEAEKRGISLDESEVQRAALGLANVPKERMKDYESHCNTRMMMRHIFLNDLKSLVTEKSEGKP